MWNKYQREKLFIIMLVSIVILPLSTLSCNETGRSEGISYVDTVEGTYLLLKLELNNNPRNNYLYCLTDGTLGSIDYGVADDLRGEDMPGEHLSKNDITRIKHAFDIAKATKLLITKIKNNNSKVFFITEQKSIEDQLVVKFEFNGIKRGTVMPGKLLIHYSNQKYPQSMQIEFTEVNK